MSHGNFYDQADRRTYTFVNRTVSGAAIIGTIQGPPGKIGRVRGIDFEVTTTTTTAASTISVGNNGAVAPAACTIPVATAPAGGTMTLAQIAAAGAAVVAGVNDVELAADTEVEVSSDGGSAAGAADIHVTIDWF